MRPLRVLGGVALLGGAFWFDAIQANRWISTFLIVAGGSLLLSDPPGSWPRPTVTAPRLVFATAIRWQRRRLPEWPQFLVSDQLATSAVTTCIALALLAYQAPWLPSATREDHPAPTP